MKVEIVEDVKLQDSQNSVEAIEDEIERVVNQMTMLKQKREMLTSGQ